MGAKTELAQRDYMKSIQSEIMNYYDRVGEYTYRADRKCPGKNHS